MMTTDDGNAFSTPYSLFMTAGVKEVHGTPYIITHKKGSGIDAIESL